MTVLAQGSAPDRDPDGASEDAGPRSVGIPDQPARDHIEECVQAGVARRALLLRLSRLPRDLARPHHLRLARRTLDPLAAIDRARLFECPNGDLFVIWKTAPESVLESAIEALALLFEGMGLDLETLAVPITLPDQAGQLLGMLDAAPRVSRVKAPRLPAPLDIASLGALEDGLAQADVSRFARRKTIGEISESGAFSTRWEKRFLSVAEIMATLAPELSAKADPWLFRRLTRSFDRRMLAMLSSPDELRGARPFSLNLNVATLLSPEFLRFDAALPPRLRGHVVLDLDPADVMADLSSYLFARDFAHARGYRLLLRGLGPELLAMFPPARIGVEFVQLEWEAMFSEVELGARGVDPRMVVLARGEGPQARAWAQREGIAMFQRRRQARDEAA